MCLAGLAAIYKYIQIHKQGLTVKRGCFNNAALTCVWSTWSKLLGMISTLWAFTLDSWQIFFFFLSYMVCCYHHKVQSVTQGRGPYPGQIWRTTALECTALQSFALFCFFSVCLERAKKHPANINFQHRMDALQVSPMHSSTRVVAVGVEVVSDAASSCSDAIGTLEVTASSSTLPLASLALSPLSPTSILSIRCVSMGSNRSWAATPVLSHSRGRWSWSVLFTGAELFPLLCTLWPSSRPSWTALNL